MGLAELLSGIGPPASETRRERVEPEVGGSKRGGHPTLLVLFCVDTMQMRLRSEREARIHAHICGDGHLYVEEGERGKRYIVEYTNTHTELVNEFICDAVSEY